MNYEWLPTDNTEYTGAEYRAEDRANLYIERWPTRLRELYFHRESWRGYKQNVVCTYARMYAWEKYYYFSVQYIQ